MTAMQMTTTTQTHKPVTPTAMPTITGSRIGVVTVPLKDSIVVSVAGGDGGGSTSAGAVSYTHLTLPTKA